jgi:pimeloyl-ACP methyl ester carboxylesterase
MEQQPMHLAALDGIELEYKIQGSGEPVVLIHPGHFADWFMPLLAEPALADRYRLLTYHRVGCAGSSPIHGAVSLAQQASHCRSLLRHIGIDRAHVVGHSSSANIALQFALDAPDVVHSLAVLEPALFSVPSAHTSRGFVERAVQLHREGDNAGAIDTFLRAICGPDYREVLDRSLPGAFDQHVADADTFFEVELPAMRQWLFTKEDARRIVQPALAVIGAKSLELSPVWGERQELLLSWLPHVEPFVLPDATHLLQVQNPRGMAEALAAFFKRHPISVS